MRTDKKARIEIIKSMREPEGKNKACFFDYDSILYHFAESIKEAS